MNAVGVKNISTINLGLLCARIYSAYLIKMLRDVTANVDSVASSR